MTYHPGRSTDDDRAASLGSRVGDLLQFVFAADERHDTAIDISGALRPLRDAEVDVDADHGVLDSSPALHAQLDRHSLGPVVLGVDDGDDLR